MNTKSSMLSLLRLMSLLFHFIIIYTISFLLFLLFWSLSLLCSASISESFGRWFSWSDFLRLIVSTSFCCSLDSLGLPWNSWVTPMLGQKSKDPVPSIFTGASVAVYICFPRPHWFIISCICAGCFIIYSLLFLLRILNRLFGRMSSAKVITSLPP